MQGIAAVTAATLLAPAVARPQPHRTFVLVHGAWHGGWCWADLARELRERGHRVTTPTLTGLGERAHLLSPAVDLETHISDVVSHIDAEELTEIVLVGHSYGGFPIRGAAAQRAEKIAQIVYLDAFVPLDGEMVASYVPSDRLAMFRDLLAKDPAGTIPPPRANAFGLTTPDQAAWVERRLVPHPVRTYLQPIRFESTKSARNAQHYIACMSPKLDVFDSTRQRIVHDKGFSYLELDTGHDIMVSAPALLARTLLSRVG
ncbi:Pyrethroid hydrolase [Bradyrhizobium ivorense]|uniref:Pyrethroid hydrolase n=1 Tax=Bradyrhizobium ivorense TaxID=2511166 RepID=A0A508TET1_9BRAD|nr:alpha/beta fold hydrolase [Bradyrhizobium ivorense]VIO71548.1 Pyrethroid hydrolase [Bradyrhizobium ivorense]